MKEQAIKAMQLTKRYGDLQALNGIDLEIMEGEFCIIAGPNGAGKTTFLKMIYGELEPSGGKIYIKKFPTPIGVMPQEASLYEDLSVWEHIYYLTILKGIKIKNSKEETEKAIRMAGLEGVKKAFVRDLSGGYKRRVNFVQALAGSNDLFLLDEPTSGLDPEARRYMLDSVRALHKKGATIVFTTHYLDEVEREAERVIIFNRGEVIYDGDVKTIMRRIGYDYEIETGYDERKIKALEGLKFSVEGNTIHLYLSLSKDDIKPELFYALGKDITLLRPSLEEAYLRRLKDDTH